MNEPQMTQNKTETPATERGNGKSQITPEQELVMRLKTAIDNRGRYSAKLADISAGFAAGRGISNLEAKATIEKEFERQVGRPIGEYLDKHYQEYKNTRSNGRGR